MNASCIGFARQVAFELLLQSIYVKKRGEFWVICFEWAVGSKRGCTTSPYILYLANTCRTWKAPSTTFVLEWQCPSRQVSYRLCMNLRSLWNASLACTRSNANNSGNTSFLRLSLKCNTSYRYFSHSVLTHRLGLKCNYIIGIFFSYIF